jgi:hypothetical protein
VYDVALTAALESVGCIVDGPTRAVACEGLEPAATIAEPIVGMRLYADGE